ncbi:type I-E CRISPR-associated protein Cas6/Cse3/CasE [Candidatus Rariloculus sp.]|uniref:type I-E CRISPR-associated protein Cas6/Cse3/CasE n=1 Tax=Candidatus Rariloculus sp. TaxID=3101265 RepID=UPI003D152BB3
MMYLTRAVLNKGVSVAALAPLLDPDDPNRALDAHHRLIWTLFPDRDATRDFLWRADGRGGFYVLSHRRPAQSGFFLPLESREFAPVMASGDRLSFVLRANATKDRRVSRDRHGRYRNRRVDVVMDALHAVPGQSVLGPERRSERPAMRMQIADRVAGTWLRALGQKNGFDVAHLQVEDYSVRKVPRARGAHVTFGLLDIRGMLSVTQPDVFLVALSKGFGRARAFGCGLMLIRRA